MGTWYWLSYEELSRDDLYDVLKLRQDVFIIEQNCIYPDIDDLDKHAWHLLGRDDEGALKAYCRVVFPSKKFVEPSIGRVLSAGEGRREGWGRELMSQAMRHIKQFYPTQNIRISAQTYLEAFYASYGFEQVSEPYLEDDIPHIEMLCQMSFSD